MAGGPHVLIVEARFYADIADELVRGATATLAEPIASASGMAAFSCRWSGSRPTSVTPKAAATRFESPACSDKQRHI